MMPTFTRNPYNAYLAAALRDLEWSVSLGNKGLIFPLTTTWLRYGRPRIIHLHWTHRLLLGRSLAESQARSAAFRADLIRLRGRGVKFVWTVHNIAAHHGRHRAFDIEQRRWLVENVDAVTVHCEAARSLVASTYGLDEHTAAAIHVVPHAAYVDCYPNEMTRAQARTSLGFTSDNFVYLFLGDIKNYKGVGELIAAFRDVEDPTSRLMIVGAASKETSQAIADARGKDSRVILHPERVADNEIQRYMNIADVVVLPFHSILTSGSTLLAMSFGKALVVPRAGCVAETVDERGAVMMPSSWRVNDLRDAMNTVRARDVMALGRHNLSVAQTLTWEASALALSRIFESL